MVWWWFFAPLRQFNSQKKTLIMYSRGVCSVCVMRFSQPLCCASEQERSDTEKAEGWQLP